MKKPIKLILLAITLLFSISFFTAAPSFAANTKGTQGDGGNSGSSSGDSGNDGTSTDVCSSNVAEPVKKAAGCYGNADTNFKSTITGILYVIIAISGLVAVTFVIIGGITYMTSSGDANKVAKARKTILYAVIGLIICALSFAIVNWTIGAIDGKSGSGSTDSGGDSSQEEQPTETNIQRAT